MICESRWDGKHICLTGNILHLTHILFQTLLTRVCIYHIVGKQFDAGWSSWQLVGLITRRS